MQQNVRKEDFHVQAALKAELRTFVLVSADSEGKK